MSQPPTGRSYRHLVSVKGVCFQGDRVLLLRNERDEWELPGGKLEYAEDPAECVAREVAEESGWAVRVGPMLDAWQYAISPGVDVLILTYGCHVLDSTAPVRSDEHLDIGLFTVEEAAGLPMPAGYLRSVRAWRHLDFGGTR
ncbi:NUDIX domain-containing protein [Actinopolymorpha sp. NPDC004070]|uniref:NUDIX hydrolase n=1 Tax=Actinopolymorpha sp. NPDC004070 TaxID=3154548 RepID=UPI0033A9BC48